MSDNAVKVAAEELKKWLDVLQQLIKEKQAHDAKMAAKFEKLQAKELAETRHQEMMAKFDKLANNGGEAAELKKAVEEAQKEIQSLRKQLEEPEELEVGGEANKAEQEKLEQDKLEQDKLEQDKLEQEKLEQEKLEQEKLEQEKLEQEKLEQEKLEQEKLEQEKLEQEKLEQEKLEQPEQAKEQKVEQKWKTTEKKQQAPDALDPDKPAHEWKMGKAKTGEMANLEKGPDGKWGKPKIGAHREGLKNTPPAQNFKIPVK
jgi:hypothetical protein